MSKKKISILFSTICLILAVVLFIINIFMYDGVSHVIKKNFCNPQGASNTYEYVDVNFSIPGCVFTKVDPFDPVILPYIKNVSLNCKQSPQLTVINSEDRLVIKIPNSIDEHVDCYYSWIYRNGTDWSISYGPVNVIPPTDGVQFEKDANVANTSCINQKTKQVIYRNVHFRVPAFEKSSLSNNLTNPSVIILVFESLGRLSYQRFMPSMNQAMHDIGNFHHLRGLTRVGENSFPNSVTLLTGEMLTDQVAQHNSGIVWDHELPYIWDTFNESGYVTSFLEDHPMAGLFSYYSRGFREPPVDFYPIEYWIHMYPNGTANWSNILNNPINYCFEKVGSKLELFLSMCSKFVEDVINRQQNPYFLYAFYSQMTHNDFNNFQMIDQPVAQFLRSLSPSVLDNSIVIVMGDHGPRIGRWVQPWGDQIENPYARVEGSLPFFAIRIPDSLDSKYPHLRKYLYLNEDRLSSWYDIHQVLLDTAQGQFKPVGIRTEIPVSYSLFREEIPISRTCEDANISQDYCVCNGRVGVSRSSRRFPIDAAKCLVDELKTIFQENNCRSNVTFQKILSGAYFFPRANESWSTYERANFTIQVEPSQAVITGVIHRSKDANDYKWSPWKFHDPTNKLNSTEYTKNLTKLLCVDHVLENVKVTIV